MKLTLTYFAYVIHMNKYVLCCCYSIPCLCFGWFRLQFERVNIFFIFRLMGKITNMVCCDIICYPIKKMTITSNLFIVFRVFWLPTKDQISTGTPDVRIPGLSVIMTQFMLDQKKRRMSNQRYNMCTFTVENLFTKLIKNHNPSTHRQEPIMNWNSNETTEQKNMQLITIANIAQP